VATRVPPAELREVVMVSPWSCDHFKLRTLANALSRSVLRSCIGLGVLGSSSSSGGDTNVGLIVGVAGAGPLAVAVVVLVMGGLRRLSLGGYLASCVSIHL
jgi:hypothetical protein